MLRGLMTRIRKPPDRSSVYAHDGDQFYFIEALNDAGFLADTDVLSPIVINTPRFMANRSTFVAHYYGMWTEMRALMMAYDEARRLGFERPAWTDDIMPCGLRGQNADRRPPLTAPNSDSPTVSNLNRRRFT
ncbi:hypothetical protein [Burkholderia sp. Bp8998]|uniref:hypothetical protein n=1 Tax=Burkholderia sp. Bp8998 TaxID=2184557 RepID=UPI000F5AFDE8|nr:hypothetical protein [Burkholderia sp. Bp8998]